MRFQRHCSTLITLGFATVFAIIGSGSAPAQDTLLINYQGRLTDSAGTPIIGTPSMTFTIYDGATVPQWTETHPVVHVSNGLFTVNLGSQAALPDSVFDGDDRYLGMSVGGDPELSPRTLMTSSAGAAVARRVSGDMTTAPGLIRLHPPDPCVPPDPCDPRMEFEATANENALRLFNVNPGFSDQALLQLRTNDSGSAMEFFPAGDIIPDPAIKMGVEPSPFFEMLDPSSGIVDRPFIKMGIEPSPWHRGYFALTNPSIGPPPRLLSMEVSDESGDWSSLFKMFSIDPGDDEKEVLEISNALLGGASVKMFNPHPVQPKLYLELSAQDVAGPSLNMYDDVGKTMGFDPSPFNEGYGLNLYDPTQLAEQPLIAISSSYGDSSTALVRMFNPAAPDPLLPEIDLMVGQNGNRFTMGLQNQLGALQPGLEITSDASQAMLTLKGRDPTGGNPPRMVMTADTDEARLGIGTESPSEPLVVGDDLTFFSGNLITVGDADPSSYAGICIGENAANRAWAIYDNDNDHMYFGTRAAGIFYNNTLVLKDGLVGIGTATPTEELYVSGDIVATGTITELSSARFKDRIRPLQGALGTVSQLKGVEFNWRTEEFPEKKFSSDRQIGMVAEDVERVVPELVHTDGHGEKSLDYSRLTAVLVEAVKELKSENEDLKARLEKLEVR